MYNSVKLYMYLVSKIILLCGTTYYVINLITYLTTIALILFPLLSSLYYINTKLLHKCENNFINYKLR